MSYLLAKIFVDDSSQIDAEAKNILNSLQQDLYWVPIKKGLDQKTKKKIEDLNLIGIGFNTASGRFYPEGSSSAHLLGFVGSDAKGGQKGYFGLEGFYEGELKGMPGFLRHEKDALGLPILIGKFLTNKANNGKDLVLNIDRSIQFTVEEVLKQGLEKYGAKAVSAVVMDPKTGAILALASFPSYDPIKYFSFSSDYYKNPIVADTYEPGSTFKVLVMAAALNEELVEPDTTCDICNGPVQLGGFAIRTWNNKYYPETSMTKVLEHSDNVGMVFVGQKLGADNLYDYLNKFGIGFKTNVDLQGEVALPLRERGKWSELDLATTTFGQGIAVTSIQLLKAVTAIANKGIMVNPHVVTKLIGNGWEKKLPMQEGERVISEQAASDMTAMMVEAAKNGESKWTYLKGFGVAGKTGTAQIPIAGHYDEEKTIASFIGFVPFEDPKYLMLVTLEEPQTSPWASETAAPLWYAISKDLFLHFGIRPQN